MTTFWLVAVALCAVAMAFLLVPVWRHRRASGAWSALGMAAAFAMVPLAFGLYVKVTTWNPGAAHQASEEVRLIQELADRLQKSPDDVKGWRLLARSYMALGKYAAARDAYAQVWKRTTDPDNDLKLAYAEAQVLADPQMLSGEPAKLIEQVLADEPDNPKALWYGGLVARELGHDDDLKARWTKLLQQNVPDEVASVVRAQLSALGVDVPVRPGEGASAAADGAATANGPSVKLDVRLGPGRSVADLGPNAALFIFARAPGPGGGPPVAVIRRPARAVPGQFTLSDANSMIPGRSLADFDELTLVARLSRSGQPTEQPGDWDAQATYKPKQGGEVTLVIDHVVGTPAPPQSAPQSQTSSAAPAAKAAGPTVKLSVTLGSGRAVSDLGPNAALFIFARAVGSPMPIAVIRRPATAVPGEFTLSDANSMIPGRSLADFDELTLVARLSKSGQPIEQPGDWYAQTQFNPKAGKQVALVIDKVVQ